MKGRTNGWENELWSYLSSGDGTRCPVYPSCPIREKGGWCLTDHIENYEELSFLFDEGEPGDNISLNTCFLTSECPTNGRIFSLVRRLARRYHETTGIRNPPVPSDLIMKADDDLPIEIRRVPLKAHHGAVWRLSDSWVIHLNSHDSPERQRFTLYHEIFHILAHCKSTPVFKKTPYAREGFFNELLADYFAAAILLPEKALRQAWKKTRDIGQIADAFNVTRSLAALAVAIMHLN